MAKSKSAYSTPGKQGKLDTHIIVVWVDNEAGVLALIPTQPYASANFTKSGSAAV